ncbi:cytosine permease [Dasania marina]|uniref:purine-cytosine permease family protein n=1 Tax=Dasania marina TaxID=471499 RepID=UPI0030D9CFA2|tara:strand:- start:25831 stop:27180 length:1350 start_codon:yes stop_codon:yes gene_type:complete
MAEVQNNYEHDGISPTPVGERTMGWSNTFRMWLAGNFVITTIMTGALFLPDLSPIGAFTAIVCGTFVGAIPLALVGVIGAETGLSTMIASRAVFGQKGSNIAASINTFALVGWLLIQGYMAGFSLNYASTHLFSYDNINLFVCLTQIVVVSIAIFGHKAIEKLENIISVAMVVTALIVIFQIFFEYDLTSLLNATGRENGDITWIIAFDISVAFGFSWAPQAGDFNRNCKSSKTAFWACALGYTAAGIIAMGLGVVCAYFGQQAGLERSYDPTVLLIASGFGAIAAFVVFLSVVSTNAMTLYSTCFSIMCVFPKFNYKYVAIFVGFISVAGALFKEALTDKFFDFILIIGTMFIPVFSIIITDYFLFSRKSYDSNELVSNNEGRYMFFHGYNPASVLCYMISGAFSYYFTYVNALDFGSSILIFFTTMILYIVLQKLFYNKKINLFVSG